MPGGNGNGSYFPDNYSNYAEFYGQTPTPQSPIPGVFPRFVKITNTSELNTICSSSAYRTNRGGSPLAIKDFGPQNQTNDLVYYPNPVQNKLYIKLNNNKIKNIVGLDGKRLSGFDIKTINNSNQEEVELDFSNYPTGMYFVNYVDEKNKTKTAKIIKQ